MGGINSIRAYNFYKIETTSELVALATVKDTLPDSVNISLKPKMVIPIFLWQTQHFLCKM